MLNPHVANEQYNSLKGKINKIKDNKLKKQFMDFISGIRIKDEDKNAILRMFQGQEGNPKVWAKKLKKYSIDIKNYCTMKHSHSSYYTNTLGSDRASAERYIETIKGIKQITKLTEEKEEVLNKIFSLLNQLKFAINSLKECLSLKGDTSNPKFNRFQKLSIQAEAYCPAAFKSLTTGPQKLQ
jgi:hypothetical protein